MLFLCIMQRPKCDPLLVARLKFAIEDGDKSEVERLKQVSMSVDNVSNTVLQSLLRGTSKRDKSNQKKVLHLLDRKDMKFDVNNRNVLGETVLHLAVLKNNSDIVKKLLSRKDINLHIVDRHGRTARSYASAGGKLEKIFQSTES